VTAWTDTHCHVDDDRIPGGTDAAIDTAVAAGVTRMICVGTDADRSRRAMTLADRRPEVWATVGLHPHDAVQGLDDLEQVLAGHEPGRDRVVAVGECGLDYYYDHSPRDLQRQVFAAHIALAKRYDLPLVIHTRDAWPDTFDLLDAEGLPERTIFHCFTGGPDEAMAAVRRGAWLSFSGIVSFPSATALREAAAWCPDDRMLVETDSPYLAPVPHRGRPNHPALVTAVGMALGHLRGVAVEHIAEVTQRNATLAFPGLAS
jgi:TatD DNase family protein